jgi:hypothetical protein
MLCIIHDLDEPAPIPNDLAAKFLEAASSINDSMLAFFLTAEVVDTSEVLMQDEFFGGLQRSCRRTARLLLPNKQKAQSDVIIASLCSMHAFAASGFA